MKITYTNIFLVKPKTICNVKSIVFQGDVIYIKSKQEDEFVIDIYNTKQPLLIEDEDNIDEIYPN